MKRIIVSGASGFLGTEIIQQARKTNIDIVAVTSNPSKITAQNLEKCNAISTDEFICNGFEFTVDDVMINCLFPTNADGYKMANGLQKVFEIISTAKNYGVTTFINISSQSVYDSKRENAAKEDDVLSLENSYAVGKYCSEMFCNQVLSECTHSNIRLASLIGVGYDQRIVNRMIDQALLGNELKVVGGMQRYGFLDVRDAAAGILKMAVSDSRQWDEVYNLGRMENYSLIDIVELIVEKLKFHGVNTKYNITEGIDNRNSSLDGRKFMDCFQWNAEISLSRTIDDIILSKMLKMES